LLPVGIARYVRQAARGVFGVYHLYALYKIRLH
jgi:hypothetical protein